MLLWGFVIIRDLVDGVFDLSIETGAIALLLSGIVWATNTYPAFSMRTSHLYLDEHIVIDGDVVQAQQIKHITPLTVRFIGSTPVVEITYSTSDADKRVVVLTRPYLVPFGLVRNMIGGKTINLLLSRYPQLKTKRTTDRFI